MKLNITSIKRVLTTDPTRLYVSVAANSDTPVGQVDVSVAVEFIGEEFMNMTLNQLEIEACKRARDLLETSVRLS